MMDKNNYRWLMKQSKPASRWLFISTLLGILSGVFIIVQSSFLATIIDRTYLHDATRSALIPLLSSLLLIIFFRAGLNYAREIISFNSAKTVKETVRKNIFKHLMSLSPQQLHQFKTGALSTNLIEQVEALHDFFSDYLPQMTIAVLLPLIILIVVFTQNWVAGIILLFTAPLIPLFMALIGIHTAKLNQENFQTLAKMSAHFLDQIQGLTTLSLFNRARSQVDGIKTVSETFREKTMGILRVAFLSSATLELFGTLSIAMIAVYLGLCLLGLIHTEITLKHALFILLLAPEFFAPLRQLGTFYHAKAQAMGAAEEILKVINCSSTEMGTGTRIKMQKDVLLSVQNIGFSYTDNKKIMDCFNLSIPANTCVAITGPSGSGKSTLLYLMAKLLTQTAGKITANGIDIQEIDNDAWREHIGFLHQNPRLFHGTILENILFGNPNASQKEIEIAIEKTGVTAFSDTLPNQLNTLINENNAGLSGGQIQRIALARIILRDAPLILLDEPTSYLDRETKKIVFKLLNEWHGKKTVIIATHDIDIIRLCDMSVKVGSHQLKEISMSFQ